MEEASHKEDESDKTSEEEYEPGESPADMSGIELLGCTPVKLISKRDRVAYYKRKVSNVHANVKTKLTKVLDLDEPELKHPDNEQCDECKDLERLINLMKEKCHLSTKREKIKILTLVPQSWSTKKTVQEFGVTEYMVRKARNLRKANGILADPEAKKGKQLAADLVDRVVAFYQSDDYSRTCPGKKDCVSVVVDGKKESVQERLLLMNLKELHIEFLKQTGDKIGFSKFCELRPKWCVPVSAIPENHEISDLLLEIVCSMTDRSCMLHLCENCPGKACLMTYLTNLFSQHDIDLEDTVNFKQWGHTDRTDLMSLQLPLNEFIEKVCDVFDALRQHHYITKAQSSYLRTLKENLSSDTAVVLMDFAENYSFLIQDAVQGFYWDNSQATLHPIVVYVLQDELMKCFSFCVISDCLKHDTTAAHAFLNPVIDYIKGSQMNVKKLVYFSDGAEL